MKIALLGSAPTSVKLAPFTDPTWSIWGCSPGLYPVCKRSDEWFELHRWEPPTPGRIDKQVPWFTPEYVQWMSMHPVVWMVEKVPQLPGSKVFPWQRLVQRYSPYFFTSSLAWMAAWAIERILLKRATPEMQARDTQPDVIGFWGVDMAAGEEYGYQRAGCQYFALLAQAQGIAVEAPAESDLLRPPGLYGIEEHTHRSRKWAVKRKELEFHIADAKGGAVSAARAESYYQGALDVLTYMEQNWRSDQEGMVAGAEYVIGQLPGPITLEEEQSTAPLRVVVGGE